MRILFYIAIIVTIIGILATVTMMVVSFYNWICFYDKTEETFYEKRLKEWERRLP